MARNRFSAPETKARSSAQQAVIDGPFAETKELIAGSFWPDPDEVECRDGRVDESGVEILQVEEPVGG